MSASHVAPSAKASHTPRTVVITGANTGIGRVTAVEIARTGARVVLAGRSRERTRATIAEIEALDAPDPAFVPVDLGDLASVRDAAAEISGLAPTIDVLINNAGLAGHRGTTTDGFELTFGVNHLGHFLLTHALLPSLHRSDAPRVVHVASRAHTRARSIPWDELRVSTPSRTGLPEYSVSKLANVLFSHELARRALASGSPLVSHALHPGVVATDIWRRLPGFLETVVKSFMLSEADGAKTTIHCALSEEAGKTTGLYWDRCRPRTASRAGRDDDLARVLWQRSAEWVGVEDNGSLPSHLSIAP
jgi:retinol dehydrogenase-12